MGPFRTRPGAGISPDRAERACRAAVRREPVQDGGKVVAHGASATPALARQSRSGPLLLSQDAVGSVPPGDPQAH